jgi:transcriptional regulator with XRE-family HTH domain
MLALHPQNVAALVNATTSTVNNWEKGRTYPKLKFIPRVHEFLGYIPFESKQRPLLDKSGRLGVVMA